MHAEILSKALELAANLAYLTALWLLHRDRRLQDEREGDDVPMIEGPQPKPQTTVVIVRSEEGTEDVIISIGETR